MSIFPIPIGGLLDFLPAEDRNAYFEMLSSFRRLIAPQRRPRLPDFSAQLKALHEFICRSPINQSVRAMICGIFFGRGFILVHTVRLKELLVRSKSGLNHCFQGLGYDVLRPSNDLSILFRILMPTLDTQLFQLRQWCLRIETENSTITFASHIPDEAVATFEVDRIPVKEAAPREPFLLDVRWLLNREPPSGISSSVIVGHLA
jgi:hypothetical protein